MRARLEQARATATAALLRERNTSGWWTGELSSSALSTATAVTALTLSSRGDPPTANRLRDLTRRGYEWLAQHQNPDGGWGDTTKSFSNLSTTCLVWAAFGVCAETPARFAHSIAAAERWLKQAAGSLEPRQLVAAIEGRYGQDRTFSIPIVTMCVLCGRLGAPHEGWHHVRQLPFEVAALPQRWFGALRLPVVSYALPALIAIGQVRHGFRPTRNPLLRLLRNQCRARTLEKLTRLQPHNGGFLEATPLTSFVTMCLAALGLAEHPVVHRGVAFLERSIRSDGSWPIDTNLTTWVTTLAVNALVNRAPDSPPSSSAVRRNPAGGREGQVRPASDEADGGQAGDPFDGGERRAIRDWLLAQHGRVEHPYTLAAPGGWGWTDLPGGVPDADDTAGSLLALHRLGANHPAAREAAAAGATWLLNLQNYDGGIPTFCRGWGKLPFDRSSPDLTGHAIRAWLAWRVQLPEQLRRRVDGAVRQAAAFLADNQRADGAWIPLWFGHQQDAADENPVYGTARVVSALCALEAAAGSRTSAALARALDWLIARQNADGGWSGAAGAASSMEETGVAVEALAAAWDRNARETTRRTALAAAIQRGATWLITAIENQAWHSPSPIGLYFAKLWYFERLYPLIFATGALSRLAQLR